MLPLWIDTQRLTETLQFLVLERELCCLILSRSDSACCRDTVQTSRTLPAHHILTAKLTCILSDSSKTQPSLARKPAKTLPRSLAGQLSLSLLCTAYSDLDVQRSDSAEGQTQLRYCKRFTRIMLDCSSFLLTIYRKLLLLSPSPKALHQLQMLMAPSTWSFIKVRSSRAIIWQLV